MQQDIPLDQIICGRNEDVLAGFPDECIDLTVTSPPYDSLRVYKGYDWVFQSTAKQLWRVTKPGGVVVWVVADATVDGSETGTSFRQALAFMGLGFRLNDTMIYSKDNDPPKQQPRYRQSFEYMFVFSKGIPNTFNPLQQANKRAGETRKNFARRQNNGQMKVYGRFNETYNDESTRTNIWHYTTGFMQTTSDTWAFEHGGLFPEKLAEDHILSWSNPGDVVLDPFVGSGTTAKMAIRHSRRFIGIDISEEYCALARRRIGAVDVDMFAMEAMQ